MEKNMQTTSPSLSPGVEASIHRRTARSEPSKTNDGALQQFPSSSHQSSVMFSSESSDGSASSYQAGEMRLQSLDSLSKSLNINSQVIHPHHPPSMQKSPKLHVKQSVQNIVYYFASTLNPIMTEDFYSLSQDRLRMKMIIKWMTFYQYYPGWDKDVDMKRQDELYTWLGLPAGFDRKLGTCIINEFNRMEKTGLVSKPQQITEHAVYSSATDVWLSPEWDGNTEPAEQRVRGDSRPIRSFSERALGKRSASHGLQNDSKRHKLTTKTCENMIPAAVSDDATIIVDVPPPMHQPNISKSCDASYNVPLLPQGPKKTGTGSRKKEGLIISGHPSGSNGIPSFPISASSVTPVAMTTPTKAPSEPSSHTPIVQSKASQQQRKADSHPPANKTPTKNPPDPKNSSKALGQIHNGSSSSETHVGPGVAAAYPTRIITELALLKDKEAILVKALNGLIQEREMTRSTHTQLCQQYEALKNKCETCVQVLEQLDDTLNRQQALNSPIHGDTLSDATLSPREVLKYQASNKLLRRIEEEKSRLEAEILQAEELLDSQECEVSAKVTELKQLQDVIVGKYNLYKEKHRVKARLGRSRTMHSGLQEFVNRSTSGPTMFYEGVPESMVFKDNDGDDDDDEE